MPPISTHMHFGKIFIENSDEEIDIHSFMLGTVSPDTFCDEDTFLDFHCIDEDGNIDVREFYEQFDMKKLNLQEKSFILGYYSHLWLDEFYKFNASKLTVHNTDDLLDDELSTAIKSLVIYYNAKAIGNYYEKIKKEINDYNISLNIKEIKHVDIKKSKEKISEYFDETIPVDVYISLIDEKEYMKFIQSSCSKIIRSL